MMVARALDIVHAPNDYGDAGNADSVPAPVQSYGYDHRHACTRHREAPT